MEEDENRKPVDSMRALAEEASLDAEPTSDPDARRDVWWLRWVKYVSIVGVLAVVLGLGFLLYDYVEHYRAETVSRRDRAAENIEHDSVESMKFRFWTGAGIGGGMGIIYVVRCVVRKVDP